MNGPRESQGMVRGHELNRSQHQWLVIGPEQRPIKENNIKDMVHIIYDRPLGDG